MKLFVSFLARETGNCTQIIDFIKTPQDRVIYYKDLNIHGRSNCGYSSLYFGFNERSQDFFMHHENEYTSFAERLFIIGVYGSNEESPDFTRCFEKWFEGTPYTHHVLGIERHLYQQTINDSVIDIDAVKTALHEFIR